MPPARLRTNSIAAGTPLDDQLAAGDGDDRGDDAERRVRLCEAGALLDVELEERSRKWPSAGDERAAADAADLLAPERDHGSRAGVLDGLDRGDDAERAVEPPAVRD